MRRGRKATGLNCDKMAELPKDVILVSSVFLFAKKEVRITLRLSSRRESDCGK